MSQIHGRPLTDALTRSGSLDQFARIDSLVDDDGPSRGDRRLRMVTGGGLEVEIHPDRALDLGHTTFHGMPMAWIRDGGVRSPRGDVFADHFAGGLMATCGMDHFGPTVADGDGVRLQHGGLNHQRARVTEKTIDDDVVRVRGTIRQSRLFGDDFQIDRTIEAPLGESRITVMDTVTNLADAPRQHMVLYHVNFGWPLVEEGSVVEVGSQRVHPVSRTSVAEMDQWAQVTPPISGYEERVYRHDVGSAAGANGDLGAGPVTGTKPETGHATITNDRIGVRMDLSFDAATLPYLFQWKTLNPNTYVLALEPASSPNMGGTPRGDGFPGRLLDRGEQVSYRVEIAFTRG